MRRTAGSVNRSAARKRSDDFFFFFSDLIDGHETEIVNIMKR